MSGYVGGAFSVEIPNDYSFNDFEADMQTAAPMVVCMDAKEEYKPFADILLEMLVHNEQIVSAYGRITAYAERNNFEDIYGGY